MDLNAFILLDLNYCYFVGDNDPVRVCGDDVPDLLRPKAPIGTLLADRRPGTGSLSDGFRQPN